MRLALILAALVFLATGCEHKDISDNEPDQVIGAVDGGSDANPDDPDGSPDDPDANPDDPDAAPETPAEIFCGRFETLCGFDDTNPDRFDDEGSCITAYESFDENRQICVEDQLTAYETDNNTVHCKRAMGTGPCG